MQFPNKHGVYPVEIEEELARVGRSFAKVEISQCDEGLYRHAVHYDYRTGSGGGPITLQS